MDSERGEGWGGGGGSLPKTSLFLIQNVHRYHQFDVEARRYARQDQVK